MLSSTAGGGGDGTNSAAILESLFSPSSIGEVGAGRIAVVGGLDNALNNSLFSRDLPAPAEARADCKQTPAESVFISNA
jgi:hypothetical protein